jgi:hypothetical protein
VTRSSGYSNSQAKIVGFVLLIVLFTALAAAARLYLAGSVVVRVADANVRSVGLRSGDQAITATQLPGGLYWSTG